MKAIRVHKTGGPEVLVLDEIPIPEPKSGEARIKVEAIGVNFIDKRSRRSAPPIGRKKNDGKGSFAALSAKNGSTFNVPGSTLKPASRLEL
jgi:NADPH:quinone reductase-like Zn-dependent oxidoreductase